MTRSSRVFERIVQHSQWHDVYLTGVAQTAVVDSSELDAIFDELAMTVARERAVVVQEKIFAVCAHAPAILASRAAAFARHGISCEVEPTFIEGAPCVGGIFAGAQVAAVAAKSTDVSVQTVLYEEQPVGREIMFPTRRAIFLAGVSGLAADSHACVAVQAEHMFRHTQALLAQQDYRPTDIVRTWIYVPRLLDWYGEFNRVRTACFQDFGLVGNGAILPASTGIQGKRRNGEECFMDVLAMRPNNKQAPGARPMHNTRQNEAYEYGSSFSRGMVVATGGLPTLYVSGTASIDTSGKTIYHDDQQGQVMETLLSIAALLEGQNAKLRDICHATAFCKGEADYHAFHRVIKHLDMDGIPFVSVFADVCRDELLFEVDSLAVAQTGHVQQ